MHMFFHSSSFLVVREWDQRLGQSVPLHGNGVVLADDTGTAVVLYVTAADGSLHIIDAASGQVRETVYPTLPRSNDDDDDGDDRPAVPKKTSLFRGHGIAVVGRRFVVYAVEHNDDDDDKKDGDHQKPLGRRESGHTDAGVDFPSSQRCLGRSTPFFVG
jgi:hypothetical protein